MKLCLDTANVKEIQEAASLGVLDGVTTNPSLVAKEAALAIPGVRWMKERLELAGG